MIMSHFGFFVGLLALLCAATGCAQQQSLAAAKPEAEQTPEPAVAAVNQRVQDLAKQPPIVVHHIDRSGRKQKGRASYYAKHFAHKKMANGKRFNPNSNVAASKTLPFGTTAKVTNLKNGRSAVVRVEDRGPFVDGRVVDLTPKVAEQLDMKEVGVTPVVVAPIAVPQRDGGVKLGAGAATASPQQIEQAKRIAEAAAN